MVKITRGMSNSLTNTNSARSDTYRAMYYSAAMIASNSARARAENE